MPRNVLCCVGNCQNMRKDAVLYKLPLGEKRRLKWLQCLSGLCGTEKLIPGISKVCKLHFEERFFTPNSRLSSDAYPSLFSNEEISTRTPSKVPDDPHEYEHTYFNKRIHIDHSYSKVENLVSDLQDDLFMETPREKAVSKEVKEKTLEEMLAGDENKINISFRVKGSLKTTYDGVKPLGKSDHNDVTTDVEEPFPAENSFPFTNLPHAPQYDDDAYADHFDDGTEVDLSMYDDDIQEIEKPSFNIKEEIKVSHTVHVHRFPNPEKDAQRFAAWVSAVGDILQESDKKKIFQNKLICDHHFDNKFKTPNGRLIKSAIPNVNLKRLKQTNATFIWLDHNYCSSKRDVLADVTLASSSTATGTTPVVEFQPLLPSISIVTDEKTRLHEGIVCNVCEKEIYGFRYVCVECGDWDLCGQCEARAAHPQHYVLRVPHSRDDEEIRRVIEAVRAAVRAAGREPPTLSMEVVEEGGGEALAPELDEDNKDDIELIPELSDLRTPPPLHTDHTLQQDPLTSPDPVTTASEDRLTHENHARTDYLHVYDNTITRMTTPDTPHTTDTTHFSMAKNRLRMESSNSAQFTQQLDPLETVTAIGDDRLTLHETHDIAENIVYLDTSTITALDSELVSGVLYPYFDEDTQTTEFLCQVLDEDIQTTEFLYQVLDEDIQTTEVLYPVTNEVTQPTGMPRVLYPTTKPVGKVKQNKVRMRGAHCETGKVTSQLMRVAPEADTLDSPVLFSNVQLPNIEFDETNLTPSSDLEYMNIINLDEAVFSQHQDKLFGLATVKLKRLPERKLRLAMGRRRSKKQRTDLEKTDTDNSEESDSDSYKATDTEYESDDQ